MYKFQLQVTDLKQIKWNKKKIQNKLCKNEKCLSWNEGKLYMLCRW